MAFIITMRDETTKEVREIRSELEFHDFIWRDGNFSCDCNRYLFFNNWENADADVPCGDYRYIILTITLDDGTVIDDIDSDRLRGRE